MFARSVNVRLCCVLLLMLASTEVPLKAYTDPGSGYLIWQVLAAGFVGLVFQVRKITGWFRSRRRD